jgi:hypothetical protein
MAPAPDANQGDAINLKPNSGLSIASAMQRCGVDLSVVIDDQRPPRWGLPLTPAAN